jgi:hypothetical protein
MVVPTDDELRIINHDDPKKRPMSRTIDNKQLAWMRKIHCSFDIGKYRLVPSFMFKNGTGSPDLALFENAVRLNRGQDGIRSRRGGHVSRRQALSRRSIQACLSLHIGGGVHERP